MRFCDTETVPFGSFAVLLRPRPSVFGWRRCADELKFREG